MRDFRAELAFFLAPYIAADAAVINTWLEVPPDKDLGDFALPCFQLARQLKKAPQKIAEDLVAACGDYPNFIRQIVATGAYVNVFLHAEALCKDTVETILQESYVPGQSQRGQGQTVLVEYSSPNIAKPFHVGHAFSTVIGESLKRIYAHLGYHVVALNHLGDYGTQFGKLMVAYDLWCDESALEKDAISELMRIYVKFHEQAKTEPQLEDKARERFRLLEQASAKEVDLWQRFRQLSLEKFMGIYTRLGIQFDDYHGESFYSDKIPAVVELLREKALLEESEGAQVVRLDEEKMPPCIILKSDGTTIYASRDLAAILYRCETYHFDKNIYVVGLPQNLHFKQVFAVLKKAAIPCADGCEHVGFGTVRFPGQNMSSRSGQVVLLEDLLNEAVAKTREIIRQNAAEREVTMSDAEMDEIAESVGVAAVQYAFLKNGRERDITFTWEDMLDFDGETAPYLQYSYARARSILRKAGFDPSAFREGEAGGLGTEAEFQLARALRDFDRSVEAAAEANEPSLLSRQLMLTARLFNKYYSVQNILSTEDEGLRRARLALCAAFCHTLDTGLYLLGMRTVERM